MVDLFVLNFVVLGPFESLLDQYASIPLFSLASVDTTLSIIVAVASLLGLGYFVMMEVYFKKTVGMMLLNIEAEGNLNVLTAITRHLYLVPLFPFTLLLFIDPLYLLVRGERLTERLTHTRTVERIRMV